MKTLDIQTKMACASAGVAVLKALQGTDRTMTYGQFAEAIGLLAGDTRWEVWHNKQVSQILKLLSVAEGSRQTLSYARLHDRKGKQGKGFAKIVKMVSK